eukprot:CAMPEP_0116835674 /NCGR_PEP_ID=MMETSP0418-20121206/7676_1 /TAXON_ID=1158023 /ORGANISM="Astrosyne radiata, Strain 13vi08-1A" /LENGTH=182 /DNA_ID=CAMNT_0004465367 /DNA_START=6 /DNA_END=554 /DNA_ORIENTATION=-
MVLSLSFLWLLLWIVSLHAFSPSLRQAFQKNIAPPSTSCLYSSKFGAAPAKKYYGGGGVGRFVMDENVDENSVQCHYDMVLCERIQGKSMTDGGLYMPTEDLPKMHLCKVLAVGPGREEENGMIAPMPNVSVGDIIVSKNPWGIGPKDEETADGMKLSYMRAQDIAAIVQGGLVDDDEITQL